MADRVTWGRPGSTGPDAWPDTYMVEPPEAAHAASELDDDQDADGMGFFRGLRVAVIFAIGIAGACAVIAWGVASAW